jgi:hypothetical protein
MGIARDAQPLRLRRQQLEEQLAREQAVQQETHRQQIQEARDQQQAQRHADDDATANQHRLAKEVQSFQQMQIGLHMRERCTDNQPLPNTVSMLLHLYQLHSSACWKSMHSHNC